MKYDVHDYLRGIYYLGGNNNDGVSLSSLTSRLGVSKNTASLMVSKLKKKNYVIHKKYGKIFLTTEGRKIAKELTQRHRLIELFLNKSLGVDVEAVHEEACRLEHFFSKRSILGLKALLKNERFCPHGKPISGR
ncbi:MAG: metal-dependent transcriptional regulator [Candidatus Anstonellales archaeon]